MTNRSEGGSFELKAAVLEGFLDLLGERESELAVGETGGATLPRRAVCVNMLYDQRIEDHGLPFRTRYVLATFAYGPDLVSLQLITSASLEMGSPSEDEEKLAAAQRGEFERVKETVEREVERMGAAGRIPVVVGSLEFPRRRS